MTVLSVWCDENLEATVDCLLPTGVIVPLHVELDTPLLDIKEVGNRWDPKSCMVNHQMGNMHVVDVSFDVLEAMTIRIIV